MKKLLVLLLLLTAVLFTHAQQSNWAFSIRGGFGWGGPKTTFKTSMIGNGFNQTNSGWLGKSNYPRVHPSFALLVKGGKQVKANTSFFVMGGLTGTGTVEGFTKENYGGTGWIDLSSGTFVEVTYRIMQLTAGLEHRLPNSNLKIGYGPSVYFFNYRNRDDASETYNAVVPGFAVSGTIPLGKERHTIGVALVTEMNLALPAQLQPLHHHYNESGENRKVAFVNKTSATMTQGMIGLAFTLRS